MRVAAIQLESVIGDVEANLAACQRLAGEAAHEGAEWIILPEFFTTGMGFLPELAQHSLPPDGPATALLSALAKRHGAVVGGSFLCLDTDGHVRNAFFLATPEGIAGRHNKDIPTMWENCFYIGGTDDGGARIVSWRPDRTEVEVDNKQPGILVVHEAYYPGWVAEIDGRPARILRTNVLFRGVEVGEGRHLVVFRFEPFSLSNLRDALMGVLGIAR